ncbi:hypothetical protein PYCCODRAFT_1462962 [Trametes coccinea BRFM310]|uniref:DUF6534 domain-containing protein n=1 Tax=Trametes coccinea (strain BRFM310) TaxID=1353009 RepID=A0A1Y2J7H4_TRAC3|nr:hypothetical protein PYCCODRAFT_1462962 [Trametes coccinea BRFM310]
MASNSTLPPIPSDIAFITGPAMVGICLNWGFMGVLVAQMYFYHLTFREDQRAIRFLVYGLFLLDILQTCLVTADAFHWFVFGFGNMIQLNDTFLNSWDVPFLDAIIATIVQTFYCWRIWILSKSLVFPVLIFLVSLTQCGAGIATAVKAFQGGELSLISVEEVAQQTTWLAAAVAADLLITIVMSYTLLRTRSRTLTAKSTIDRIVRVTVETNMLTAGVAVIALGLYLGFPDHSTLVVPPTAIIGKLYSNCLVAVLNGRRLQSPKSASSPSYGSSANTHSFRLPTNSQTGGIRVEVLHQTEMDHEMLDMPKSSGTKHPDGILPV